MFENVQTLMEIKPIQDPDIPGFQVALEPVVQWLVRELRLHGKSKTRWKTIFLVRIFLFSCVPFFNMKLVEKILLKVYDIF